jgi:hypothetical protein
MYQKQYMPNTRQRRIDLRNLASTSSLEWFCHLSAEGKINVMTNCNYYVVKG